MPDEVTVGDMLKILRALHRKRKVRLKVNGQAPVKIARVTIDEDGDEEVVVIELEQAHGRGT